MKFPREVSFLVVLFLLSAPDGVYGQEECVVCNQDQECELWDPESFLDPGSGCDIHYVGGQQWCQWTVDWECDPGQPLSPLLVTAAGTHAVPKDLRRRPAEPGPCDRRG